LVELILGWKGENAFPLIVTYDLGIGVRTADAIILY